MYPFVCFKTTLWFDEIDDLKIKTLWTDRERIVVMIYASLNRPKMLRKDVGFVAALVVNIALMFTAVSAYAQDGCQNIGQSEEWRFDMQALDKAVQEGDLSNAQVISERMYETCPNAPLLNYVQGKMYEKLGDKQKALFSYQKASENTYHFAVDPNTAQKIWYARYEFEHPERTSDALEIQKEVMANLQAQCDSHLEALNTYKDEHHQEIEKWMWAGTGIGAGGLALIGTGAALVALYPASTITQENKDEHKGPYVVHDDAAHSVGLALIGVGAGLLVGGSVLAGIYGYKYTHFKTENTDMSLSFAPNGVSFGLNF